MAYLTPSQTAAVAADYLLTTQSRIALMSTAERKAFEDQLAKSSLSPKKQKALLAAFDLEN